MPRRPRKCPAGTCFHVINRAVARLTLFEKESDYEAFDRVLALAYSRVPLPIYSYIVMPNHWHFVVQPETDTQRTEFFRWLTHTHTMRWHGCVPTCVIVPKTGNMEACGAERLETKNLASCSAIGQSLNHVPGLRW